MFKTHCPPVGPTTVGGIVGVGGAGVGVSTGTGVDTNARTTDSCFGSDLDILHDSAANFGGIMARADFPSAVQPDGISVRSISGHSHTMTTSRLPTSVGNLVGSTDT